MKFVNLSSFYLLGLPAPHCTGFVLGPRGLSQKPHLSKTHHAYSSSNGGDFDDFASSPRSNRKKTRFRNEIEEAFRELEEAIQYQPDCRSMSMKMDRQTTQKWIDKAFDLASELNSDFAVTPREKEINNERIKKSRDWIARVYDSKESSEQSDAVDPDVGSDIGDDVSMDPQNLVSTSDEDDADVEGAPSEPSPKVSFETPVFENRSNDEKFEVAIDLPGVKRTDVEVTVEGDFLVVVATRIIQEERIRGYRKKFILIEDEVEIEKMTAVMKDGVLVVSVPKRIKPKETKKRTIPITE